MKYIVKGFALGVRDSIESGFVGLLLQDRDDDSISIKCSLDLPSHMSNWGDKRLFNYMFSTGTRVDRKELDRIANSEEKWALVKMSRRE